MPEEQNETFWSLWTVVRMDDCLISLPRHPHRLDVSWPVWYPQNPTDVDCAVHKNRWKVREEGVVRALEGVVVVRSPGERRERMTDVEWRHSRLIWVCSSSLDLGQRNSVEGEVDDQLDFLLR